MEISNSFLEPNQVCAFCVRKTNRQTNEVSFCFLLWFCIRAQASTRTIRQIFSNWCDFTYLNDEGFYFSSKMHISISCFLFLETTHNHFQNVFLLRLNFYLTKHFSLSKHPPVRNWKMGLSLTRKNTVGCRKPVCSSGHPVAGGWKLERLAGKKIWQLILLFVNQKNFIQHTQAKIDLKCWLV